MLDIIYIVCNLIVSIDSYVLCDRVNFGEDVMKIIKHLLPLLAVLLLAGCTASEKQPTTESGGSSPHSESNPIASASEQTPPADPSIFTESASTTGPASEPSSGSDEPTFTPEFPSEPTVPITPPVETAPPSPPEVTLDGLLFESFGRYSGAFVEDGSDRSVVNTACILVENTTDRYLELATASFEIDGVSATFVITGLPPHRAAWVLESKALSVKSGASFILKGGTATFCDVEEPTITAQMAEGTISVMNSAEEEFSGYIYYKMLHTDGNFLGGITYRSYVDALPPQSTTEITAGHSSVDGSELVRVMAGAVSDG